MPRHHLAIINKIASPLITSSLASFHHSHHYSIMNPKDQTYKSKFMAFAIRMVKLKNYLNEQKHEYNIADQIQRSGTAIGANHREATFAESDMDFIHKLSIAQKECSETIYWLELLKATEYINEQQFEDLYKDAEEIMRMLTSSIMTARKRLKK
jgi:four helix bundle protein